MEGVKKSVNKVIVNMWHIKNTNGLYYYALDYIDSLKTIDTIVLRKGFPESSSVGLLKEKYNVVHLSVSSYLLYIFRCYLAGVFIFTPSSHPLPFLKKQLVIVHDMYPFAGTKGWLKKKLFKLSVKTARCKVGYINSSSVKNDLLEMGIPADRFLFCPNKFPQSSEPPIPLLTISGSAIIVGLVGTDSDKKNYHNLFTCVRATELGARLKFIIYGHETEYFNTLCSNFQDLDISLVRSDEARLELFMTKINVLISVCVMEGFGRPVATSLVNNVPTHLIRCNVFEEFFEGGAYFYNNIDELLYGILNTPLSPPPRNYHPPIAVLNAYKMAIEYIRFGR